MREERIRSLVGGFGVRGLSGLEAREERGEMKAKLVGLICQISKNKAN